MAKDSTPKPDSEFLPFSIRQDSPHACVSGWAEVAASASVCTHTVRSCAFPTCFAVYIRTHEHNAVQWPLFEGEEK